MKGAITWVHAGGIVNGGINTADIAEQGVIE